ncbi:mycofactocin-coupled SDR family oxidoreductase [Saccharopolyspora phatthalungensis]|uniref:(+)-trans-carveol dehydrogenase n=1 Tax=Saccharopolyspora phatthalungensis TaxID=664693 RepID=A0A840QET5_9PSEU|nr:mycofactocin-coupled SDR family oxidoreductase [Saccharopolyspora phatthalungensis]MBB5158936.1 (+)-trans-carveol dehydrogenase [Saccharopolyspora phatthalungensis]
MSRQGRVAGKVALVTGAARGQGRSHAVRLAEEGASIIAIDACAPVESINYPLSTPEDLRETQRLVEEHDARISTHIADVRDQDALRRAVRKGVAEFGRLDIVCANAGIASFGRVWELTDDQWTELLDINLTGVWRTVRAAVPAMISAGHGGSLILTASFAANKGVPNIGHYVASKHAILGLMRTLAVELAEYGIRANTVNPSSVGTGMFFNEETYKFFRPDLDRPGRDDMAEVAAGLNLLPVPWVEPVDISNAVVYLASDEARYVTGSQLAVDAGAVGK